MSAPGQGGDVSRDLVEVFGLAVRQLREAQGWSQEQLAERSDLNRSYVGEIERGCVIPSLVTASKLAGALGLGIAELLANCERLGGEHLRQQKGAHPAL